MQDPKNALQAVIKKKKKFEKVKVVGEGMEGFIEWTNPEVSQSVEERDAEMFGLVAGFAIRMHKRAANAREGTTPDLEVLGDKRSRPSRFDEVQVDSAMIVVDTSDRVLKAPSAFGGVAQDASRNAYATLENEIQAKEFPRVDDASTEASHIKATDAPPPRAKRARFVVDGVWRPPNRMMLSSYVEPMEWAKPTEDAPALDQETTWVLINYGGPSTRGTLSSRTCSIFSLTAFAYRRWLVRRNTPSPSPSTWIRGPTNAWPRTGCICPTMTSMRLSNWYG